jgi:predicted glutamine amidotransferase
VRYATAGGLAYDNTHPFEQDGRLFAHNGVVNFDPAAPVDPSLVHGQTDSERLFERITLAIRAHGGDVRAGIAEATRRVAAEVELHSLNFILTTPDEVWALRYPEHNELLILEHPREPPLDQSGDRGIKVRSDDAAGRRVVVLASERIDDHEGWNPLAPGELVHVDADLRVTREIILPDPPAHPLALSDHEADAQAQEGS